jgi:hypothetical protein
MANDEIQAAMGRSLLLPSLARLRIFLPWFARERTGEMSKFQT